MLKLILIAILLNLLLTIRLSLKRKPKVADQVIATFLVTDPVTGFTIEGADLTMNLKNNQKVSAVATFKNRQGGPAAIQAGSAVLENTITTGAYTAVQDPENELKVLITGNPQSGGSDQDIGIVRLTVDGDQGEGVKSLVCELAVNVIPGDAEIAEFAVGPVEDQA